MLSLRAAACVAAQRSWPRDTEFGPRERLLIDGSGQRPRCSHGQLGTALISTTAMHRIQLCLICGGRLRRRQSSSPREAAWRTKAMTKRRPATVTDFVAVHSGGRATTRTKPGVPSTGRARWIWANAIIGLAGAPVVLGDRRRPFRRERGAVRPPVVRDGSTRCAASRSSGSVLTTSRPRPSPVSGRATQPGGGSRGRSSLTTRGCGEARRRCADHRRGRLSGV